MHSGDYGLPVFAFSILQGLNEVRLRGLHCTCLSLSMWPQFVSSLRTGMQVSSSISVSTWMKKKLDPLELYDRYTYLTLSVSYLDTHARKHACTHPHTHTHTHTLYTLYSHPLMCFYTHCAVEILCTCIYQLSCIQDVCSSCSPAKSG